MRVTGEDDLARLATSFNEMAASLQEQIRQLEELSRVQRRFVSDVSHELRTPLTTIRMAGRRAPRRARGLRPGRRPLRRAAADELDRFEALLADLLEISRFDAGAAVLDAEPVDLARLVAPRRRTAPSRWPTQRGSPIIVAGAGRGRCVAEVDARRVERILRNLVVNAIEHGEGRADRGRRSPATTTRSPWPCATTASGCAPGEAALVFNRFWRADPARARTTGGTGLGLAIALEDARLHGGWLQAWGEPGGGSQFRLTVPRTTRVELLRSPIPLEPEDSSHHLRQRRGTATAAPTSSAAPASASPVSPSASPRPSDPPMATGSGNGEMLGNADELFGEAEVLGNGEMRDVIGSDGRRAGDQN